MPEKQPHRRINLFLPSSQGSVAIGSLLVSLYLVVLAFFIVLNAISQQDADRTTKAIGSVRHSFATTKKQDMPWLNDLPEIESAVKNAGTEITVRSYFSDIGDVAREAVTLVSANIVETGDNLQISIPTDTFFITDSPFIRQEQEDFMKRLAEEIIKVQKGKQFAIEFIIGFASVTNEDVIKRRLILERTGTFARTLTQAGVSEKQLFIGVDPLKAPAMLTLNFYIRGK